MWQQRSFELFMSKPAGYLAHALSLLFLGLMLWAMWSSWHLRHGLALNEQAPRLATYEPTFKQAVDVSQLTLFGRYLDPSVHPAPFSSAKIRLLGVLYDSNQSASQAIIAVKGGPGKAYQVGKKVDDSTVLKQVDPHAVIIQYQGQLFRLPLKSPALTANQPTEAS